MEELDAASWIGSPNNEARRGFPCGLLTKVEVRSQSRSRDYVKRAPGGRSAYGRLLWPKSNVKRALASTQKAVRWPSLLRARETGRNLAGWRAAVDLRVGVL
jgi:hypothetical protein